MKKSGHRIVIALVLFWLSATVCASEKLTAYVDPFIGTDGTGHTFPGAAVPFGMVAPSPDNADTGWSYSSGYQYKDKTILGFSNTHISGAGINELGDVLLQPGSGKNWTIATRDFSSSYDKTSERAKPGFYRVRLTDNQATVELTTSQRVAFQRYRFDQQNGAQVLADFQHGLKFMHDDRVLKSDIAINAANNEISGTVHTQGWVTRQYSFVLRFDQPFTALLLPARAGEKAPRYVLNFKPGADQTLEARIAFSTVDVAGARRNLAVVDGKSFAQVQAEAEAQWQNLLARARIEAPDKQKRIFYTALYHAFIHPSDIADSDGRVRGPDGKVMQAPGGVYYSTLSLWDTFRGVHPLFTLLVPERVDGMINTLLAHQSAQGYLPLWTAWGQETHTMIGNPALPVIANAVASGFTGFDRARALQAMIDTSTKPRPKAPAWAQRDWSLLDHYGYLPFDKADGEAVSKTLELGIGDDAVARVAAQQNPEAAAFFRQRAGSYQQLYDAQTQLMRGRDSMGQWRTPFDPLKPTSPMNNPGDYTEANAWQYSLTPALHDPEGLRQRIGGPAAFGQWLDTFFSVQGEGDNKHLGQEAMIGQYAHGNEPSHHIAYLYAFTPTPWQGHVRIRQIYRQFYTDAPSGIVGNDDCGQMSAWYVLSTLGFYPVTPSRGEFVLGAPQAAKVQLSVPGRKPLTVLAEGFGEHAPYARAATLDGKPLDPTAVSYRQLAGGGVLRFSMGPMP
jgi:predicted alpha-1,2-mannosidase